MTKKWIKFGADFLPFFFIGFYLGVGTLEVRDKFLDCETLSYL